MNDIEALQAELILLKGADGRYVFGDGGGLDETMDAIRPYLRPALTAETVREALEVATREPLSEYQMSEIIAELRKRGAFGKVTP